MSGMEKESRAFVFTLASIISGFVITFVLVFLLVAFGGGYIDDYFTYETIGWWYVIMFGGTLLVTGFIYKIIIERKAYRKITR